MGAAVFVPNCELFSNGPDGLPWTSDDVRLDPYWSERWETAWDGAVTLVSMDDWTESVAWNQTKMRLLDLGGAIGAFFDSHGDYPQSLDDLVPFVVGGRCTLDPTLFGDSWGQPFHFSRSGADFQLCSVGPDGIPMTHDDLALGAGSRECFSRPTQYWPTAGYRRPGLFGCAGCTFVGSR